MQGMPQLCAQALTMALSYAWAHARLSLRV